MHFHDLIKSTWLSYTSLDRIGSPQFYTLSLAHHRPKQQPCQITNLGLIIAGHTPWIPNNDLLLQILRALPWLKPVADYKRMVGRKSSSAYDGFQGY